MAAIIVILGLIIGSFLNVCIYRIPLNKSVVYPGSGCPHCGRRLAWFELLPVVSCIFIRGRCRYCGTTLSWRYPFVEISTAVIFTYAYIKYGITAEFGAVVTLASLMTVASFIDIDYKIIPNRLVLTGLFLGTVIGAARADAGLAFIGLGFAAGFGLMFLVAVVSRGQMGLGDVKLSAVMGVFLGWKAVLVAIFFAFTGGALYGLFLMAVMGQSRKTAVPFGPFLAVAAVLSVLWSDEIISWYLNLVK
ncbi:MAG: prepilin peptidase [Eubacteriales bacterium]